MSSAPVRGIVPHRQRRHHHHHYHHHHEKQQRRHHPEHNREYTNNQLPVQRPVQSTVNSDDGSKKDEEEKRPKVNPIFLWAAQHEQRIVEVRCEDYDKRNRIKLTKTAQGWRSIPRTALTAYPIVGSITEDEGEQQETLSTTSKNEEKENTSRERLEIKQVVVDELEDTRVDDARRLDKVDETQEERERERHKRKRKKHSDFFKNKKRKTDSETEEFSGDVLVTTNWKMKKRRKLDKNKKRKKMCEEEEVLNKNKINNSSEIKVKQESKKEAESIDEAKKTEELSNIESKEHKMCINNIEKVIAMDEEYKKCNDLDKLQKNRHLQPRVVLEQLHLSQLPTRIHRRLVNRAELENNAEQSERNNGNNIDEIVEDNVENSNHINNGTRIDPEEAIVDKEDFQEIFNMLDANHFPINDNETKSSLIESKDLARNYTKLGAAILNANQKDDNKIAIASKECAKQESDLSAYDKRNKFGRRDNIKHRVGSKSLDETIERLERSINYQKNIGSLPNIVEYSDCEIDKQKNNKIDFKSNDRFSNCQNTIMSHGSNKSPICEDEHEEKITRRDILESSKILNVLRNTPGLSITLATNGRKHHTFVNVAPALKKILPSSRSPDSQSEVAERIGICLPRISVGTPGYQQQSKVTSPASKNRVESPESTVNFPKNECCQYEADIHEVDDDDCDSQAVEEVRNQNHYTRYNSHENQEDGQNYCDDESKEYTVHCTKVPNLKPLSQVVSRNSEAQAKYSSLFKYQEIDNFDDQMIEEFHLQVSPQPSGIPYSVSSSRRSSSAYLERLLPSPPCSVSCSEDAKNDLTLKGILSSPNNVDSRSQEKKEEMSDSKTHCDSELSPTYNHSEERFLRESSISDKTMLNQRSQRFSQETVKYFELRNHSRPMSSGDVHSPFAADYVSPKRPLSAEWATNQQRIQSGLECFSSNIHFKNQKECINRSKVQEAYVSPTIFLDPASQLRELIKTSGHLIPDPLLVPRDYLPLLASAPLTEIPKLLATRPELRLPEALTRPELLRDPDLLVISLAHLQHVLDHGEGPASKSHYPNQPEPSPTSESKNLQQLQEEQNEQQLPKLSCKPIGKLMPAPMDLSSNQKLHSHPPLLRVRSGLLKQESEVSSTASSPDDSQLWHPLFGSQKLRQQHHQQQQQQQPQHQASWHRATLAS